MEGFHERQALYERHRGEIDNTLRVQWILWAAIVGQTAVFIVLCQVFGDKLQEKVGAVSRSALVVLRAVFAVLGVFSLGLSYFLRRHLLSARFKGFAARRRTGGEASGEAANVIDYVPRVLPSMVIPATLSVDGFMLFLLGDSLTVFYLFVAFSLVGLLYHRPRMDEILMLCGRLEQAEGSSAAEQA